MTDNNTTTKVTVRLSTALVNRARIHAQAEGVTLTEVYRAALEAALYKKKFKLDKTKHYFNFRSVEVKL